ncbi:MAG: thiol oxidoreductase [Saprospiraceae bacterium]|nr:thiol oxidoreductase [Saprospiraceae bacterium]
MKIICQVTLMLAIGLLAACQKTLPFAPEEEDLLDGPVNGLNLEEKAQFLRGDAAFNEVFTIERGLGPIFVANQCASCHPGDGKGSPFVSFIRFGQADTLGNLFLDQGGPQLQHKAIPGFEVEQFPAGAPSAILFAPAVTGLGFLDAVSDEDILQSADPNDQDGDGISGRPHWNQIPDYVDPRDHSLSINGRYITRFGKKAGAYDLLHQTSSAYNQDMGVTSSFESIDPYSGLKLDPEVNIQTINDVVFYLKTLKAPIARNQNDSEVIRGREIFGELGCIKCHLPQLKTGLSPIAAISDKTFYPYTDLLLHDMGPGLDDGYTEGFALSSEWRTPPLWGLGLSTDSQGGNYFLLHDGRARSIEEAIILHGGEAADSRGEFTRLSPSEKKQLIRFLEAL